MKTDIGQLRSPNTKVNRSNHVMTTENKKAYDKNALVNLRYNHNYSFEERINQMLPKKAPFGRRIKTNNISNDISRPKAWYYSDRKRKEIGRNLKKQKSPMRQFFGEARKIKKEQSRMNQLSIKKRNPLLTRF